jgi:hypothetical protein
MRRFVLLSIGIGILTTALVFSRGQAERKEKVVQEKEALNAFAAPPPKTLDAFYPPKAEQPIFLFRMLGLSTSFSGIVADLVENEVQHAKADFEKFKADYVEVSKLVSEWRKNFPMGPVDELGTTLRTGNRSKVMTAYEKVGYVCHKCHIAYMPAVQQKYHWGNFFAINIKDPLSNKRVAFSQLMKYLDANFAGISVSAERADRETAQKQLQGFNARFQALKETCANCHDTERKYYVDDGVQALVDKLGQALNGPSVEAKVVEPLRQRIGMESCIKCHWVHVPAAYAKFQLAGWEKAYRK